MKNEFMDLYNDIVKDEKKKEMPLSFDEFLEKTDKPKKNKDSKAKRLYLYYSVAASVVLLLSLGLFWTNWNTTDATRIDSLSTNIEQKTSHKPLPIVLPELRTDIKPLITDNSIKPKDIRIAKKIERKPLKNNTTNLSKTPDIEEEKTEYIYINGKPIHNREEALDITYNTLDKVLVSLSKPKAETNKVKRILKNL